MSGKTYGMREQLQKGEEAELFLDSLYEDRFEIMPASRDQQKQGIDRIYRHKHTLKSYTIEYKTDWTAGRTNNAFIETVSVDSMSIPGWAHSSEAEWLFYYLPHQQHLCIIRFSTLRHHLDAWLEQFEEKPIKNKDYHTWGIPVPLAEFMPACEKIVSITDK